MKSALNIPPLLFSLVAINLFGHIALSGGRVSSSLFALENGYPEAVVGALISLYGLLPMLLSITVGRWVDRIGSFVPMRLGMISVVIGIALPGIFPQVTTLFATAALCGLGFMIVSLSAQHSVGCLCGESTTNRVAYFGWLSLGHSTSGILGPLIVGFIIDLGSYQAAFIVLASSACVALLLVLSQKAAFSALHVHKPRLASDNILTLIREPTIRRIYIVGILIAISWDLFIFLMPILGHRRHLSASAIGTILAAFAAGTFSIRLITVHLAHLFTEWRILRTAIVVIVIVYVALPLTQSIPLLLTFAFVLGAAVGSSQPNMLSLLHAAAPSGRGAEAIGLRGTLANASMVAVPLMFGATAASFSLAPIFWTVAVLVGIALPLAHRGTQK
ncbi:MAG: MFS transporter [Pseudomonadota bacterium]